MKKFVLVIGLAFVSTLSYGNELELKMKAADKYLETNPVGEMIDTMATNMIAKLPPKDHDMIIEITKEIDTPYLEGVVRDALIKTYTLEEINAFTDFYGSGVGRSVYLKMGTYKKLINKPLKDETIRATSAVLLKNR